MYIENVDNKVSSVGECVSMCFKNVERNERIPRECSCAQY